MSRQRKPASSSSIKQLCNRTYFHMLLISYLIIDLFPALSKNNGEPKYSSEIQTAGAIIHTTQGRVRLWVTGSRLTLKFQMTSWESAPQVEMAVQLDLSPEKMATPVMVFWWMVASVVSDWSERAVRSSDWNFFMALCGVRGKRQCTFRWMCVG